MPIAELMQDVAIATAIALAVFAAVMLLARAWLR